MRGDSKSNMFKSFSRGLVASCAVLLAFSVFRAEAVIDSTLQMQLGNPSLATADTNNHSHYLIQRTVEAIDYNDTLGLPNWASWDLTASDIGSSGRSSAFVTDTNLPAGFYEVTTTDYSGVGFDRGHMCPSADRTDSDTDNAMVFYLSNIIPQTAANNEGVWGSFEDYCRTLAQSGNELLIICGPGGFNGSYIQPSQRVYIPGYTWKIVVVVPAGAGTALSRITSSTRVIAIKIPNTTTVSGTWQSFVTSARQIEADTGFTFFTALPSNVANALRNQEDGLTSSPPAITSFSPGSGSVGSSVIISGTSFSSASEVTFKGVSAAFHVDSASQITATVPTNAVSGLISVTIPTGTALSSNNFSVTGSVPDLGITTTHFGSFSQLDSGDTYTVVVTNQGTIASTGVVTVVETLPTGLTATAIGGVGWTANLGMLTCTRSNSLFAGASYPPITVVVNVASNAPASVTNTTTVSGGGETNTANDVALDATTINPSLSGGVVTTLYGWDVSTLPGGTGNYGPTPYAPTFTTSNMSFTGLTRGTGLATTSSGAAHAWGAVGFTAVTSDAAITTNQVITFGSSASNGYTVSYASISKFDYRRSASGPATGIIQYQVGSGTFSNITALAYPSNTTSGGSLNPINLAGFADLQAVGPGTNVTFRVVNYGGGPSGTWYFFDVSNSTALDFAVSGTVSPIPTNHPDLVVSLSHAGSFRQGDGGDIYTITVTNNGNATTFGAVNIADTLPAGLSATSLSGAGWTANLGSLTCSRSENLAPGSGYPPITLVVNVATNAGNSLTNIAIVSGGGETNTANNTASDPTVVVALTPIQLWRFQWFGTANNSGVAADSAISSSDAMPNVVKYAFGLNPYTAAANPVVFDISTGYLRLTAPKNTNATDVSFMVETTGALSSALVTNGITIDQNSVGVFRAHRNASVTSSPSGFMRLDVVH